MPVINQYDKPARDIRPGNILFGEKVIKVEPKRVNTLITLDTAVAGRAEWGFKLTDMLTVGVLEKTDEEKAAERAAIAQEKRKYFVEDMRKEIARAKEKVADIYEQQAKARASNNIYWGLQYSDLEKLLTAEANFRLMTRLEMMLDRAINHAHEGECEHTEQTESGGRRCVIPNPPVVDEVEQSIKAAVAFVQHCTTVCVRHANRQMSRSTSTTSNIIEDVDAQVAANFIDGLRWSFIPELNVPSLY